MDHPVDHKKHPANVQYPPIPAILVLMNCTNCGREIPSENINIQLAIAKCDACNAVFSFYDQPAPPHPDADSPGTPGESEVSRRGRSPESYAAAPLPRGVSLEDTGRELRIRRRWFGPQFLFLTFFTGIWDIFLLLWFGIAIRQGQIVMALVGVIHLAVGLGLTYYTLAGYLNSTIVAVNPDYLVLHHKPLPWRGAATILAGDVERLVSRGSTSFSVSAVLLDQREFTLIGGLENEAQALRIEEEAGRYLKPGKFRL